MSEQEVFDRRTVIKNTALILACVLLLGMALRTLVAREIEPLAVSVSGVVGLLLLFVYRRVSQGAPEAVSALAVMFLCLTFYIILSWTSHGLRGSVIFVAPMFPLVASLMLDRRGVRNTTIVVAGFLLFVLAQHLAGNLQPDESYPEENRYAMRAIILLFCLVAATWIVGYHKLVGARQAEFIPEDPSRDPLTGLLTRQVIDVALERELVRARRAESWVSLAVIEIDRFDVLEQELGPQAMENCLLGVADAMRYSMRRNSDALGRYSPRQLCMVMSVTDPDGAAGVGRKFRELIADLDIPLDSNRTTRLTVSIAVASLFGRNLAGAIELSQSCEDSLRKARSEGGDSLVVKELG